MRFRSLACGTSLIAGLCCPAFAVKHAFAQTAAPGREATDTAADRAARAERKRYADQWMTEGRALEAFEVYRVLYEQTKEPALLYNQGRAQMLLRDYARALELLEAFDRDASPELKARVGNLGALIRDVASNVAVLEVQSKNEGARVVVGKRDMGTVPLATPIRVNEGPLTVSVALEGFRPYQRDLAMKAKEHVVLDVRLEREGSPRSAIDVSLGAKDPSPAAENKGVGTKWWLWVGLGVVAAAAIAGTIVLLSSERSADTGNVPPGQIMTEFRFR